MSTVSSCLQGMEAFPRLCSHPRRKKKVIHSCYRVFTSPALPPSAAIPPPKDGSLRVSGVVPAAAATAVPSVISVSYASTKRKHFLSHLSGNHPHSAILCRPVASSSCSVCADDPLGPSCPSLSQNHFPPSSPLTSSFLRRSWTEEFRSFCYSPTSLSQRHIINSKISHRHKKRSAYVPPRTFSSFLSSLPPTAAHPRLWSCSVYVEVSPYSCVPYNLPGYNILLPRTTTLPAAARRASFTSVASCEASAPPNVGISRRRDFAAGTAAYASLSSAANTSSAASKTPRQCAPFFTPTTERPSTTRVSVTSFSALKTISPSFSSTAGTSAPAFTLSAMNSAANIFPAGGPAEPWIAAAASSLSPSHSSVTVLPLISHRISSRSCPFSPASCFSSFTHHHSPFSLSPRCCTSSSSSSSPLQCYSFLLHHRHEPVSVCSPVFSSYPCPPFPSALQRWLSSHLAAHAAPKRPTNYAAAAFASAEAAVDTGTTGKQSQRYLAAFFTAAGDALVETGCAAGRRTADTAAAGATNASAVADEAACRASRIAAAACTTASTSPAINNLRCAAADVFPLRHGSLHLLSLSQPLRAAAAATLHAASHTAAPSAAVQLQRQHSAQRQSQKTQKALPQQQQQQQQVQEEKQQKQEYSHQLQQSFQTRRQHDHHQPSSHALEPAQQHRPELLRWQQQPQQQQRGRDFLKQRNAYDQRPLQVKYTPQAQQQQVDPQQRQRLPLQQQQMRFAPPPPQQQQPQLQQLDVQQIRAQQQLQAHQGHGQHLPQMQTQTHRFAQGQQLQQDLRGQPARLPHAHQVSLSQSAVQAHQQWLQTQGRHQLQQQFAAGPAISSAVSGTPLSFEGRAAAGPAAVPRFSSDDRSAAASATTAEGPFFSSRWAAATAASPAAGSIPAAAAASSLSHTDAALHSAAVAVHQQQQRESLDRRALLQQGVGGSRLPSMQQQHYHLPTAVSVPVAAYVAHAQRLAIAAAKHIILSSASPSSDVPPFRNGFSVSSASPFSPAVPPSRERTWFSDYASINAPPHTTLNWIYLQQQQKRRSGGGSSSSSMAATSAAAAAAPAAAAAAGGGGPSEASAATTAEAAHAAAMHAAAPLPHQLFVAADALAEQLLPAALQMLQPTPVVSLIDAVAVLLVLHQQQQQQRREQQLAALRDFQQQQQQREHPLLRPASPHSSSSQHPTAAGWPPVLWGPGFASPTSSSPSQQGQQQQLVLKQQQRQLVLQQQQPQPDLLLRTDVSSSLHANGSGYALRLLAKALVERFEEVLHLLPLCEVSRAAWHIACVFPSSLVPPFFFFALDVRMGDALLQLSSRNATALELLLPSCKKPVERSSNSSSSSHKTGSGSSISTSSSRGSSSCSGDSVAATGGEATDGGQQQQQYRQPETGGEKTKQKEDLEDEQQQQLRRCLSPAEALSIALHPFAAKQLGGRVSFLWSDSVIDFITELLHETPTVSAETLVRYLHLYSNSPQAPKLLTFLFERLRILNAEPLPDAVLVDVAAAVGSSDQPRAIATACTQQLLQRREEMHPHALAEATLGLAGQLTANQLLQLAAPLQQRAEHLSSKQQAGLLLLYTQASVPAGALLRTLEAYLVSSLDSLPADLFAQTSLALSMTITASLPTLNAVADSLYRRILSRSIDPEHLIDVSLALAVAGRQELRFWQAFDISRRVNEFNSPSLLTMLLWLFALTDFRDPAAWHSASLRIAEHANQLSWMQCSQLYESFTAARLLGFFDVRRHVPAVGARLPSWQQHWQLRGGGGPAAGEKSRRKIPYDAVIDVAGFQRRFNVATELYPILYLLTDVNIIFEPLETSPIHHGTGMKLGELNLRHRVWGSMGFSILTMMNAEFYSFFREQATASTADDEKALAALEGDQKAAGQQPLKLSTDDYRHFDVEAAAAFLRKKVEQLSSSMRSNSKQS